jgi:hypothetical protein
MKLLIKLKINRFRELSLNKRKTKEFGLKILF